MKRTLLALSAWLLSWSLAFAQPVPQVGVTFGYVPKATYSAGFIGLVPAASATDTICLAGSASKVVKLLNFTLSGSAGTLVTLPITLVRRASLDTGGTAATTTANPANTISNRDSTLGGTATAVPISYTAVPTINDTSPTYIASASLTLNVTSAAGPNIPLVFDFAKDNANLNAPPTINKSAVQQFCINLNTISVSSGLLNGSLTWSEE